MEYRRVEEFDEESRKILESMQSQIMKDACSEVLML
jgi:hypothetical protein